MLHVTSGSLLLHLGPEQFTAQAGDLIIILPHVIHHGFTGPDGFSLIKEITDLALSEQEMADLVLHGKLFLQTI